VILVYALSLVGVAFIGWCAGMVTFTKSRHWCPKCGATLRCPDCRSVQIGQARVSPLGGFAMHDLKEPVNQPNRWPSPNHYPHEDTRRP